MDINHPMVIKLLSEFRITFEADQPFPHYPPVYSVVIRRKPDGSYEEGAYYGTYTGTSPAQVLQKVIGIIYGAEL